jgi:hypothetical protein
MLSIRRIPHIRDTLIISLSRQVISSQVLQTVTVRKPDIVAIYVLRFQERRLVGTHDVVGMRSSLQVILLDRRFRRTVKTRIKIS